MLGARFALDDAGMTALLNAARDGTRFVQLRVGSHLTNRCHCLPHHHRALTTVPLPPCPHHTSALTEVRPRHAPFDVTSRCCNAQRLQRSPRSQRSPRLQRTQLATLTTHRLPHSSAHSSAHHVQRSRRTDSLLPLPIPLLIIARHCSSNRYPSFIDCLLRLLQNCLSAPAMWMATEAHSPICQARAAPSGRSSGSC